MIKFLYEKIILKFPLSVLFITLLGVAFLGYQATKLEIDASAETLLLDDDKDLKFTREVSQRYKTPDFLVIAYSPHQDLLSTHSLGVIQSISNDILKLPRVESITSILNVPLLESPVIPISDLVGNIGSLSSRSDVDKDLVKHEFLSSPLYKNNLVSSDFGTTSILINLKNDDKYNSLLSKRNHFRTLLKTKKLSIKEKKEYKKTKKDFKAYRDALRVKEQATISSVREIMKKYKNQDRLFLGGVEMISSDLVDFVKNDLKIYGTILLVILMIVFWIIFRRIKWVLIPLFISFLSVLSTAGILGLFKLEVTVLSSNFISLQLIITISLVLHLIVRYRELSLKHKNASQYKLVLNTSLSKWTPSVFAIITTMVGFASLVLSGIKPVMNLGLMMSGGIAISLLLTFVVFPALMMKLKRDIPYMEFENKYSLTVFFANAVRRYKKGIFIGSFILFIWSLLGANELIVENSFINYFKKDTEIYQGMKVIDQKLGGTTPLDIILTFKKDVAEDTVSGDSDFDDFESEFKDDGEGDSTYWFTSKKLEDISKVHRYLDSLPQIGNVQSIGTILNMGKILNEGKDLGSFEMALLNTKLPEGFKKILLNPYLNIEANQVRFSTRIIDSDDRLRRNEFIGKINKDLKNILGKDGSSVRLSNLMILYNNMLQSLFSSQILTLGVVFLVLFVMFFILFRSIKIALISLVSNMIPISIVFGVMGWFGIPLDIVTITIAAISIGIGVDDTIHYVHRYEEEFKKDKDYESAMLRAHNSIGYAMYYTTFAVMVGFIVLVFSNFVPTIYFGLLTVLAMFMMLMGALLLLPRMLIYFQPYGKHSHYYKY